MYPAELSVTFSSAIDGNILRNASNVRRSLAGLGEGFVAHTAANGYPRSRDRGSRPITSPTNGFPRCSWNSLRNGGQSGNQVRMQKGLVDPESRCCLPFSEYQVHSRR